MIPPNVNKQFEENAEWVQAQLIAYTQIRELEEIESDVKGLR